MRCVVPPTEECDIPTTPTPLDGDGENNNVSGGQLAKDEQERKVSVKESCETWRALSGLNKATIFICLITCTA